MNDVANDTDAGKLLELAARCEGAGPEMQGRLLEEAWEACAEHSYEFQAFARDFLSGFDNNAGKFAAALEAAAYESAALMLVPEQCYSVSLSWFMLDISTGDDPPDMARRYSATVTGACIPFFQSIGTASPALALTAAALRARAAS